MRYFFVTFLRSDPFRSLLALFNSEGALQYGGLAQLGERLICIQEVNGSIPLFSTIGFEPRLHLEN